MTFFSIVMPVYNSEKYLKIAVESVLNQTYSNFELILVDDGSKDGSALLCDIYAEKDCRVKVIHQKNSGICNARNVGIGRANGLYIGFIDNDDQIDKHTLEICQQYITHEELDWIKFGKIEILENSNGEIVKEESDCIDKKLYEEREILDNLLSMRADGRMTYVWDGFFLREIVEQHNLKFDTNYVSGNEDIDFCEEYAQYAKKLSIIDNVFYKHYTRMGVSASSKYSEQKLESYLYLLKKSNERYEKYKLKYENNINYQFIVSKQILLNIVQKLNDAGELLTKKQKKEKLLSLTKRMEMQTYNKMDPKRIKIISYKLYLYDILYKKRYIDLLLNFDKYSRKIVYGLRCMKERK